MSRKSTLAGAGVALGGSMVLLSFVGWGIHIHFPMAASTAQAFGTMAQVGVLLTITSFGISLNLK